MNDARSPQKYAVMAYTTLGLYVIIVLCAAYAVAQPNLSPPNGTRLQDAFLGERYTLLGWLNDEAPSDDIDTDDYEFDTSITGLPPGVEGQITISQPQSAPYASFRIRGTPTETGSFGLIRIWIDATPIDQGSGSGLPSDSSAPPFTVDAYYLLVVREVPWTLNPMGGRFSPAPELDPVRLPDAHEDEYYTTDIAVEFFELPAATLEIAEVELSIDSSGFEVEVIQQHHSAAIRIFGTPEYNYGEVVIRILIDDDPQTDSDDDPTDNSTFAHWYNVRYSISVVDPSLVIVPDFSQLPDASVGDDYETLQLLATGGTLPYRWSLGSNAPDWIDLTESGELVAHPPAGSESYIPHEFELHVEDDNNLDASISTELRVVPSLLGVVNTQLPSAIISHPYLYSLIGHGGVSPYTWDVTGLPTGVSYDPHFGTISGAPVEGEGGAHYVSISLSDGVQNVSFQTQIVVVDVDAVPQLEILNTTLASATVGQFYRQQLFVTNAGEEVLHDWSDSIGYATGLSIISEEGGFYLLGTPAANSAGTYTVRLRVRAGEQVAERMLPLNVALAQGQAETTPSIDTSSAPILTNSLTGTGPGCRVSSLHRTGTLMSLLLVLILPVAVWCGRRLRAVPRSASMGALAFVMALVASPLSAAGEQVELTWSDGDEIAFPIGFSSKRLCTASLPDGVEMGTVFEWEFSGLPDSVAVEFLSNPGIENNSARLIWAPAEATSLPLGVSVQVAGDPASLVHVDVMLVAVSLDWYFAPLDDEILPSATMGEPYSLEIEFVVMNADPLPEGEPSEWYWESALPTWANITVLSQFRVRLDGTPPISSDTLLADTFLVYIFGPDVGINQFVQVATYYIDVVPPPIEVDFPIESLVAPPGEELSPITIQAGGGTGELVLQASGLPEGLTLDSDGVIGGVPRFSASSYDPYTVTIEINDSPSQAGYPEWPTSYALLEFQILVEPYELDIFTTTLPSASENAPYAFHLVATGGLDERTWDMSGLPVGLDYDSNTGLIEGHIPSASAGDITLVAQVSDGTQVAQTSLLLSILEEGEETVVPELNILNTMLPQGSVGSAYSVELVASGGDPAQSLDWSASAVPVEGLGVMSASDGAWTLSGVPNFAGVYQVVLLLSSGTQQVSTTLELQVGSEDSGESTFPTSSNVSNATPLGDVGGCSVDPHEGNSAIFWGVLAVLCAIVTLRFKRPTSFCIAWRRRRNPSLQHHAFRTTWLVGLFVVGTGGASLAVVAVTRANSNLQAEASVPVLVRQSGHGHRADKPTATLRFRIPGSDARGNASNDVPRDETNGPAVEPVDPDTEEDSPEFFGEPVGERFLWVLDFSHSMIQSAETSIEDSDGNIITNPSRLEVLKIEAIRVLTNLSESCAFNIVELCGDATDMPIGGVWRDTGALVEATEGNIDAAIAYIQEHGTRFGTPAYTSLNYACTAFGNDIDSFMLLTDGMPTPFDVDSSLPRPVLVQIILESFATNYAPLLSNGCTLHCFFIGGTNPNATSFLQALASQNNGEFTHIQ